MSKAFSVPPEITIGDQDVVLSRSGQSRKRVARILGREVDPTGGRQSIWLDRLIHRPGEKEVTQGNTVWGISGAISSVLTLESTTPANK